MSNLLNGPLSLTDSLPNDCPNVWTCSTNDTYAQITAANYMQDILGTAKFPANTDDMVYIRYDVDGTPGVLWATLGATGTLTPDETTDTLTDSYIYVGNASNLPVGVAVSGS